MRGVEKSSPPSNVSPDGQIPRGLAEAEEEYLAALPGRPNRVKFANVAYGGLEKVRLREVMHREQKSLCTYCERAVSETGSSAHVEHWRPRSRAPEYALHWRNLYLSCSTKDTCGIHKADRPLKADDADPDLPWPTELDYEELVGFTSRGEMYVRDDVRMEGATRRALELAIGDGRQDGGGRRRAILNLNHATLVEARSAALDSERTRLRRAFEGRTPSRAVRAMRARRLLERRQLPAFVSIRVSGLRRTLGQGR